MTVNKYGQFYTNQLINFIGLYKTNIPSNDRCRHLQQALVLCCALMSKVIHLRSRIFASTTVCSCSHCSDSSPSDVSESVHKEQLIGIILNTMKKIHNLFGFELFINHSYCMPTVERNRRLVYDLRVTDAHFRNEHLI